MQQLIIKAVWNSPLHSSGGGPYGHGWRGGSWWALHEDPEDPRADGAVAGTLHQRSKILLEIGHRATRTGEGTAQHRQVSWASERVSCPSDYCIIAKNKQTLTNKTKSTLHPTSRFGASLLHNALYNIKYFEAIDFTNFGTWASICDTRIWYTWYACKK